jgi:hypothetical protein
VAEFGQRGMVTSAQEDRFHEEQRGLLEANRAALVQVGLYAHRHALEPAEVHDLVECLLGPAGVPDA